MKRRVFFLVKRRQGFNLTGQDKHKKERLSKEGRLAGLKRLKRGKKDYQEKQDEESNCFSDKGRSR